jgi:hypothetical protein
MSERIIPERVVNTTLRFFSKHHKSDRVSRWLEEEGNLDTLDEILIGYDRLISAFNKISPRASIVDIMPKTRALHNILDGRAIPTIKEMSEGNFVSALFDARDPIMLGEKIKNGSLPNPSQEEIQYAIGTPSMDTATEAIVVGTVGHLVERTFFKWTESINLVPKGVLKKDDFLQALDEVVMLHNISEGEDLPLTEYFLTPNSEGGLGWISEDKIRHFNQEVELLFNPNLTQRSY